MKKIKVLNIANVDDYFKDKVDESVYEVKYKKRNEVTKEERIYLRRNNKRTKIYNKWF